MGSMFDEYRVVKKRGKLRLAKRPKQRSLASLKARDKERKSVKKHAKKQFRKMWRKLI